MLTKDDSCWTTLIGAVAHRLGDMPDTCFTCAAKRAEDRAQAIGPEGSTCATCEREFATSHARDSHQATAHVVVSS